MIINLTRLAEVPPLTPDADEARKWAEEELARDEYAEVAPTAFDQFIRYIVDVWNSLTNPEVTGGVSMLTLILGIAAIIVIIVVVFLVGRPRSTARAGFDGSTALFGDDTARSGAEWRKLAADAARTGRWNDAIVFRVRAIARRLDERGILDIVPGTTVQGFVAAAAPHFEDLRSRLDDAANVFDDVRYLRREGTAEMYAQVAATDDALEKSSPRRVLESV